MNYTLRLVIVSLLISISMFNVSAQTKIETVKETLAKRGEVYFKFDMPEKAVRDIIAKEISIAKVEGKTIYAYASEREFQVILDYGIDYTLLTAPSLLYKPKMFGLEDLSKGTQEWDAYPTYDAYVAIMQQFAADYPDICKLVSFGTLDSGRELLALKISDNVDVAEDEPEFLYTGTMHGDETVGYILLLHLIDDILQNYGTNPYHTNLVDNVELWINPLANPDGTYHAGNNNVFGATRYNANGVDLNRNYPDPEDGDHPDGNPWQSETLAFIDLAENHNFDMSANTHSGDEVVNYPWDTWARLTADDAWWQFVSHEYADTCQQYSPVSYMDGFNDGITNGYDWYTVSGGRQDFMNYFHNCREFVVEMSMVKLLPESELQNHWEYNYRSLYNYIDQSLFGLRGVITDAESGQPIKAKIEIVDHDIDNSFVYSTENVGDYHRYLKEGSYDVMISAPGYFPQTFENVSISDYDVTVLNAQLEGAELIADFTADKTEVAVGSDVQFTDNSFGDVASRTWTFEGGTPASSTEENPVVTYENVGSFDVSLTVTNAEGLTHTVLREDYISAAAENVMQNGSWTICDGVFFDTGGRDDDYSSNEDLTFTIYPATSGAMLIADFVEFSVEFENSCSYDWLKIYDGTSTSAPLVGTYCGSDGPGKVTASNDEGALTFEFQSDGSQTESGWKALISCEGDIQAPDCDFSADDVQIVQYNSVEFFDNSTNNPESWTWTFEGGDPETSDVQNPVVTYNESGTFDVTLTVENAAGSDTMTKENYIVVGGIGIELNGANDFTIYPNPGIDHLSLSTDNGIKKVEIYNLEGKLMLVQSVDFQNIDINDLPKGQYLIRVVTTENKFLSKSFTKL